jgi:mannose-6-phosphate isomerase-like protein (cupin superfamily)
MAANSFVFRGTKMTVKLTTEAASGHYTIIEMTHPPSVGPALHVHPAYPETFYVQEGDYTFFRADEVVEARIGDCVTIAPGIPHRYEVGKNGGKVIVISPPHLEKYFCTISQRLLQCEVSQEEEKNVAAKHGQHFLDMAAHWEVKP